MRPELTPDEALVQRLPLPLAQLYRRAHNAQTALERQLTAFYLWEAALKLLASAAIVEYAEQGPADSQLVEPLHNLARPSLGHWWEFGRLLVPALAQRGDESFQAASALLLGKPRDDCPRAAGLDALLREALERKSGARATVQFGELFGRLVAFRNTELGHGAAGQRSPDFYERMGSALLAGLAEVLARLDVLGGRRLLYAADVRRLPSGNWLIERYDLHGEAARRLESQELPDADANRLPRPGRLYLHPAGAGAAPRALHPLVVYDAETGRTFFLNARRGQRRVDYLCYATGEVVRRDELGGEQRELLAKVLGAPVQPDDVERWAGRSQAEEGPAEEQAPQRRAIGEFELISRLGRGGMGVVYRAWQPSLGRQVALKCLLRAGDPKAEARFAREIHALGRVEHPHLVKVFTSGAEGEQWFYAMELVEGADLSAVCARLAGSTASELGEDDWTAAVSTACEQQRQQEQPLSDDGRAEERPPPRTAVPHASAGHHAGRGYIAQVAELVWQAAEAAHALHEAGVIHRDIKPGNIVVSADGRHAVLMDLGLAQLIDEAEGRLTRTRQFVGTLRYASPEQVLAAGRMDRRTDVYSLGATLWELLTLRPLFGADEQTPTPDLMLRIQTTDPERPRKYNPRVPKDLEAIVVKCLEKDRVRRYATAADFAADLGRWQRGEPVLAQPPSLSYLLRKRAWRYRVPLSVAALVLLAAVAGVIAAFVQITSALDKVTRANADAVRETDEAKRQRNIAENKGQELQDALGREQDALAKLQAQFPLVAQGFSAKSDAEFRKGNAAEGLNWMLRAYQVAPENDPARPSYLNLLVAQGRALGRPLGRPLLHDGNIESMAISPDGRAVLTASADKTARLWDATTGKGLATFTHEGTVWSVDFSPDSRRALTGSADKTARVWDVATGKQLLSLPHGDEVWGVDSSPDGRTILTACNDKQARLWDAATGRLLFTLPHDGAVRAAIVSLDSRTALTGSEDNTARLWDVATGRLLFTLPHEGLVWALAYSPDSRTLLTGSKDKTARLWDAATGKQRFELRHDDYVNDVAFGPDGKTLLTASADKQARLWDAATGKQLRAFPHDSGVLMARFNPDGRTALTGSWDKTARLWSVRDGKLLATLPHASPVWAVGFSPDGRTALTSDWDRTAILWDLTTGRLREAARSVTNTYAVAFSPDGHSLLTGGSDHTAQLADVATGKLLTVFRHDNEVWAVAFSPDGKTVLTGSADKTARLWDAGTGKPLLTLAHDDQVMGVAFSPDGRTLLTGSQDKTARLWDAATGKELRRLTHDDHVQAVAYSPDGRTVLTGGRDWVARLWDAADGKPLLALRHDGLVGAVAFSPDGHTLLTASDDNTARLWDASSGKPLMVFRHDGAVHAARFSADGRTVLTCSSDRTARVWDVPTGQQLAELPHSALVWVGAFHPDRHTALTFAADATSWRWDVLPSAPNDPTTLQSWVAIRTLKVFDGAALHDLSRDERLRAWDDFAAHGGDGETPLDARTWHLVRAGQAEAEGDEFALAFHLSQLPEPDRDSGDVPRRRGYAEAALGRWDKAVADFRLMLGSSPEDIFPWYWMGLAYLGADDLNGYRDHCRRMLDHFATTRDPNAALLVVWLASLSPGAVSDPQRLVDLARFASTSNPARADYLQSLGAALYRAGRYAEATQSLNEAGTRNQPAGPSPGTQLFLALATERLGQQLTLPATAGMLAIGQDFRPLAALPILLSGRAAAREWLARAERQISDSPSPTWIIEVQRRYLLQEARALIMSGGVSPRAPGR